MSPTIYGVGTGLFNKLSIQVPTIIRAALKEGQVDVIGEGKGIWDYVHIADLAALYKLVFDKIVAGEEVPTGEKGFLFSSTGRFTWFELSSRVADALFKLGAIKADVVRRMDLEEAAKEWSGGLVLRAELGFASK
jgi:nucleoside-diphosphate-sugar epimerase